MEDNEQLKKLETRIPYENEENLFFSKATYRDYLKSLLEDSKNIALSTLYPFIDDFSDMKLPSKYYNWQLRACEELHKMQGNAGIKAYSENGLSWSRDNDGPLSNTLMSEIEPSYVGIPKRRDIVDNK